MSLLDDVDVASSVHQLIKLESFLRQLVKAIPLEPLRYGVFLCFAT